MKVSGLRLRLAGLSVLVVLALAFVALALADRGTTPTAGTVPPPVRATAPAVRAPLTRAEETYIRALWPIHGEVERSTVRMSLGEIFYTTRDLTASQLKARVEAALVTYRQARGRLGALEPPPSLQSTHEQYVAAVGLFERSALIRSLPPRSTSRRRN